MKYLLLLLALAGCARKLPVTPSYSVVPSTMAKCIGETATAWDTCSYVVENGESMHYRVLEFKKARAK